MQISNQEVARIRKRLRHAEDTHVSPGANSVEELAARYGVSMDEVRKTSEKLRLMEEDPARKRRLQDIARRVQSGAYQVETEQLLDMAERRAIADRSAEDAVNR